MSYLAVEYSLARVPRTDFPQALIGWLSQRFQLQGGCRVLEIGCGRGDFLVAWQDAGFQAVGADREAGTPWAALLDFETDLFPYPDACFDIVFSKSLIEHITSPAHMLRECLRVLRPGGRIIVMTPDWRTYMRTFYDDYTHVRPYDRISLAHLLAAIGFAEGQAECIYQYPPIWRHPVLRLLAAPWRWLVPVELSLVLSRRTGVGFFRWASQLTVLASGLKPGLTARRDKA